MKKNDEFVVTIDDIGINMEGIAHFDGQTFFVPFAIVGERVRVRLINTKSNINICKVIDVIEKSPYRVEPLCPYFTKCGGCDCMHIDYKKQLEFKTQNVKTTLDKLLGDVAVNKCIPSPNYHYRNKMAFPIVDTPNGTVIGMYRLGSHKIIELKDCIISNDFVAPLIAATKDYIAKFNIQGYNEETGGGLLRHLVARMANGQLLITLVATSFDFPQIDYFVLRLKECFENFNLSINLNKSKTNVILGKEFKLIYGKSYIDCVSFGIKYPISPYSFMQVNDYTRDKIYDFVLSKIDSTDNVVDAYSGAGLLTAMMSKKAKHCYGIEIVESAVKDANNLIKLNEITNVKNILGDCAIELPKLLSSLTGTTTLVLDPPRKGCASAVLDSVLKCQNIDKIIYISCNPATLARDLKTLTNKFDIESINPFDMFPNTKHIETVVCLKGKSIKN